MPISRKSLLCILLLVASLAGLAAESMGLQFLQSLAVPGLSQIRSGRGYGYGMLASELGIISTLLYLDAEQDLKTQDYFEYALKYAHIQNRDYPDQYYRDLSRYDSSGFEAGGYNSQVRADAMQLYPNDPLAQQQYIDSNAYPDDYAWSWDSTPNRSAYSKIRVQTQNLRDYGKMALGVLIVNHLISGIDVLRYNAAERRRSQVYLDIRGNTPLLNLCVEW